MKFLNLGNALTVLAASVLMAVAAPTSASAYRVGAQEVAGQTIRTPVGGSALYTCDGTSHLEIGLLINGVYQTTGYDEYKNLASQKTVFFVCLTPEGALDKQQVFASAGTGFEIEELSLDPDRLIGVKAKAK